jgi:hypothetical protein
MKAVLLLLVLLPTVVSANDNSIQDLRALYFKASTDKVAADRFLKIMETVPADAKPLMICYKGLAYLLQAKLLNNPYSKYTHFRKGKLMLEAAVKAEPANVEIRSMRYCVQTNAPFFLGYHNEINADEAFLMGAWNNIADQDLKKKIKEILLGSKECTEQDKAYLLSHN